MATPAERRQRETTSAAVLAARVRAAAAKAAVPSSAPKGRLLRKMQEKELDQKVAESKAQVGLLETRTAKEEVHIQLLEQQIKTDISKPFVLGNPQPVV